MAVRIGCGRPGWRHAEERSQRSLGIPGAWTGLQTHCRAWPGSAHHGAVSNEPAWETKKDREDKDWAELSGTPTESPGELTWSLLHPLVWVMALLTAGTAGLGCPFCHTFEESRAAPQNSWQKDVSSGNPAALMACLASVCAAAGARSTGVMFFTGCKAGAIRLTPLCGSILYLGDKAP